MGQAYENIWSHTHTHIHTPTYAHTHTHIYIYTYIYTYTHTYIYTYTRTIETYGPQPTNTNIWPSATPTANQYKHMAQRRIIETYGHTIAGRSRHAWPILLFVVVSPVISLLT